TAGDGGTEQITSTSYTVDYEEVGDGTWFFDILACGPTGDCHVGETMEIAVSEGTPQTTELPATGSSNGLVIYVLLLLTGGGLLALSARHRPRGHA
ncbi:MAG: LPXTG cell wall anchor domain-containing protein, partial [Actinomycetota bacterium]|nr:LPXTG cell wall anchor domain-containing protein [Actinomycetota bacterium]